MDNAKYNLNEMDAIIKKYGFKPFESCVVGYIISGKTKSSAFQLLLATFGREKLIDIWNRYQDALKKEHEAHSKRYED